MPFFNHTPFGFSLWNNEPPTRPAAPTRSVQQTAVEESLSLEGPPDALVNIAGRIYHYFAGSGYFGLQSDPEVLAATCEAVLRYGVGTATTRAAFTSPPVFEVERRVATMIGAERTFYTASGYTANQILLEGLEGTFDRLFIDESSHYSLFDAAKQIRGNRCRPIVFKHRNVADLKEKLDTNLQIHERPLVLTDGVFSFLGTIAPIADYVKLLAEYDGASLLVDDAHGFGVLGKTGRGTLEHCGFDPSLANRTLEDASHGLDDFIDNSGNAWINGEETASDIPVNLFHAFSLSKAVGGCGGAIPGSESFVQRLKERSSVFIGASAPPNPIAAATAKALAILVEARLRDQLRQNVRYLKGKLRKIGLEVDDTPIPIAILTLGSSRNMRRIQKRLSECGNLISYLPRYAGLGSEGALRIAVFATHTEEMIDDLVDTLGKTV